MDCPRQFRLYLEKYILNITKSENISEVLGKKKLKLLFKVAVIHQTESLVKNQNKKKKQFSKFLLK